MKTDLKEIAIMVSIIIGWFTIYAFGRTIVEKYVENSRQEMELQSIPDYKQSTGEIDVARLWEK